MPTIYTTSGRRGYKFGYLFSLAPAGISGIFISMSNRTILSPALTARQITVPRLTPGRVFRVGGVAITMRRDGWYVVGPFADVMYSNSMTPGAGGVDWCRTRSKAVRTLLADAANGIGR
jgi:hypothetical protein